MTTVRKTNKELREHPGRTDRAKITTLSETDRQRFMREDGYRDEDFDFGSARWVVPATDVRALRERLGLTQEAFAQRYFLSVRTVQDWEQDRREPTEIARTFLYAIARDPEAVRRLLHRKPA